MAETLLIYNALIINENESFIGNVFIENDIISDISAQPINRNADKTIDATGHILLPGVIDDQVHFRTPGLTHKGDIESESKAAIAGGVTSYMDMPNVVPPTTSIENLEQKFAIAKEKSWANYSFYFGATNDNIDQIKKLDPKQFCGIKVFMGSSTGNMLVDDETTLNRIFSEIPALIAVHCEDEATIKRNTQAAVAKYGDSIPISQHPIIRSDEACYKSTLKAVELAKKHNTRLHVLHVSTAKELSLFDNTIELGHKRITAEVCVHHLWFTDADYNSKGALIKWNPAVKSLKDREALRSAINSNLVDIIATDHAPHTFEEKQNQYLQCPSGAPMVQHSLITMLELVKKGVFSYNKVVQKMCHAPAKLFRIEKRGFIKPGYYADLVIVTPNVNQQVTSESILYKCGWSPLLGETFSHRVLTTIINGKIAFDNDSFIKQPVSALTFVCD
ncbi:MAG TPA: dihydroorotase [Salinivirgaceae bacterium]|nr:dihydroorotase [Salinivirgaceae bacterium]